MAARLGVLVAESESARGIAAHSRNALDRSLRCPAELRVAVARDRACLLGAFQRSAASPPLLPVLRRGSGGPEVLLGEGSVHLALALAHPAALLPCDEKRIVNRYVRPLLRALGKTTPGGMAAHYFGRDWISVGHRPVAWVGFAHDAATRRTVFEAFVAVRRPFASSERASFRGAPHGTLEEVAGASLDSSSLAAAIAQAYATAADTLSLPSADDEDGDGADGGAIATDPPWAATCQEAIGTIGAGPDAGGVFRVGGDLLVSRDALARLEARAPAVSDSAALGLLVDETLGGPGVAVEGVRSLTSIRDVILRARGA